LTHIDPMSRRGFLVGLAGTALAVGVAQRVAAAEDHDGDTVTSAQSLRWLRRGNARWVRRDIKRADHTPPYRDITNGQWPIASVVSCADSRVNAESVFDVAQGNLFNVRNAGNVGGDISIGSIEYSVGVLKVPLLVVLGHSSCGAVVAAQRALRTGEMPGGDIDAVVEAIIPAIERLPVNHTLEQAIEANAAHTARLLRRNSRIIDSAVSRGRLRIMSAVYDIRSRRVEFATRGRSIGGM